MAEQKKHSGQYSRYYKSIILSLVLLPCLSVLEIFFRGKKGVLLFHDFLIPSLTYLLGNVYFQMVGWEIAYLFFFIAVILLYSIIQHGDFKIFRPLKSSSSYTLMVSYLDLILLIIWLPQALWKPLPKNAFGLFMVVITFLILCLFYFLRRRDIAKENQDKPILLALTFLDIFMICSWLSVATWKPSISLALAAITFLVFKFSLKSNYGLFWSDKGLWSMGILAAASFFIINLAMFYNSEEVQGERLYNLSAYHAAKNSAGAMITLSRKEDALFLNGSKWDKISGADHPQRIDVDVENGAFYISNFNFEIESDNDINVTRRHEGKTRNYIFDNCRRAIDVKLLYEPKRLIVLCEATNNMLVYDLAKDKTLGNFTTYFMPYSVSVDQAGQRAYVSTMLIGLFHSIDLKKLSSERSKFIGVSWGTEVDEKTGNIYVARYLAGDVIVMDKNLKAIDRIDVGYAPRELAIDKKNRRLIAGNYVTGTVHIIDLDSNKTIKVIRIKNSTGFVKKLRGVNTGPAGKWLVCDINGVWEIPAL